MSEINIKIEHVEKGTAKRIMDNIIGSQRFFDKWANYHKTNAENNRREFLRRSSNTNTQEHERA